ncbi:helix-turn-helix domain-containing protein [Nocardia tengchongensis]
MTELISQDRQDEAGTRERKAPPYVSLRDVRVALDLSLDDLRDRIKVMTHREISNGSLSAIETGQRGASREALADIEAALHLPSGSISTTYLPRHERGYDRSGK